MGLLLVKVDSILKGKGYRLFTRPYELNIVGLRSRSTKSNKFDDELHVFYRDGTGKKWVYHVFSVTTDPGTYYLGQTTGNSLGTAILAEGQYLNSHAIGLHKGKYKALVQVNPVSVIRDYDRDSRLDFKSDNIQKGSFGINIHRASSSGTSVNVNEWSAGCTVFADVNQYEVFMSLCEKHRALYGNHFTYTLIDFRDRRRKLIGNVAVFSAISVAVMAALKSSGILDRVEKEIKKQYA